MTVPDKISELESYSKKSAEAMSTIADILSKERLTGEIRLLCHNGHVSKIMVTKTVKE